MTTEAGWFHHLAPKNPTGKSSETRFEELFGTVVQLEVKIESLFQLMEGALERTEARLKNIEARLPPAQAIPTQAKRHDSPLFSYPP
jgi:hypothetical protein